MPGTFGSAPLLTPWFGMWDIANGSPEYQLLTAAGLFTLVLAGVILAFYGGHFRAQEPERKTVAVHVPRAQHRRRHRRR